jgi:hypothetical protein
MKTKFHQLFIAGENLFLLLVAAFHPGFSFPLPDNALTNTELPSGKMEPKTRTSD